MDNAFLREEFQVSEEKLETERDSNINLISTVRMNLKASKEAALGITDEEKKRFLSGATCIELLSIRKESRLIAWMFFQKSSPYTAQTVCYS